MRIISGKWGGRKINPPVKMPHTRPTTDIAKEGLFNILQHNHNLDGIHVLDLFGGTGSISYELLSRGAASATIVEKDPAMHAFIRKNLEKLGAENAEVIRMDVFRYLETSTQSFDFIFAGPPYALTNIDDIPQLILKNNLIAAGGIFVLEHTPANNYEAWPGFRQQRNYGTTVFTFFERLNQNT